MIDSIERLFQPESSLGKDLHWLEELER